MGFFKKNIATKLRRHCYKFTPQRWAVIQIIDSSEDHLTPAAIYEKVHQEHPNIGLVTVYRTLDILAKMGLICELHAGGSCHSYTAAASEHHHHLICSSCNRVVDVAGYDLKELEQRLSLETGFEIEDHLLEFVGLCHSCQQGAVR